MTTKPLIGNFSSVGDTAWTKSDGTSIGSINGTTGAWTLGQSGLFTSNAHTFNGGLTVNGNGSTLVLNKQSTPGAIAFQADGVTKATLGAKTAGGYDFSTSTVLAGQVTDAGFWTLGPSGLVGTHQVNGRVTATSTVASNGDESYFQASNGTRASVLSLYKHSGLNPTSYLGLTQENGQFNFYWSDNSNDFRYSTASGHVGTTSGTVIGTQTSDQRVKKDVASIGYGLPAVMALSPVSFVYTYDADERTRLGFIAQEVQNVVPQAVYNTHDRRGTVEDVLAMDTTMLVPVLVKAIQELKADLDTAKARITELEGN